MTREGENMAGFFSPEGKLYKFMDRFTDVFKLNMLWILFSLPIVTMGAATIAVSTVTLHMTDEEEGNVGAEFLSAFKSNLRQGIAMTFLTLIPIWALYLDFQIASVTANHAVPLLIMGLVSGYVIIFSLLYVYPLLARYENTVLGSLRNSFRISMKFFMRSVLLLALLVIELALIFLNGTTIFIGLLIGPVFINYTISGFASGIFKELEKIPGTVVERESSDTGNGDG